jgi:dihydrofolate synthase/folylpolyglutamate synthase
MRNATWPARMQRLRKGPLIDAAPEAELWLDGGHNPHAARAIAEHMRRLPERPTYLVCGMLNTKDVAGFMAPFAGLARHLWGVSIKGQKATLPASETATHARAAGIEASEAETVLQAVEAIARAAPHARILICGSLYFAGEVLSENG